jgi:hypothetical protein
MPTAHRNGLKRNSDHGLLRRRGVFGKREWKNPKAHYEENGPHDNDPLPRKSICGGRGVTKEAPCRTAAASAISSHAI